MQRRSPLCLAFSRTASWEWTFFAIPVAMFVMQEMPSTFMPRYRAAATRISESFHACGGAAEARAFLEEVAKA